MSSHKSVLNITRQFHMKLKRAERGIQECSFEWVEFGVSVRDLTVAEAIEARNRQARTRELLPLSELPGIRFEQPKSAVHRVWEYRKLALETAQFVA